jgi:hypothetical protein
VGSNVVRAAHVLVCSMVIFAGGASVADAKAARVDFHELAYGGSPGQTVVPDAPVARIVRDAQAARTLLQTWDIDPARTRVGAVDFTRRAVIVLLAGFRPTAGYRARVLATDLAGGTATVTAAVTRPRGLVADVVARPWVVVSVPRAAVARARPEVRVVVPAF